MRSRKNLIQNLINRPSVNHVRCRLLPHWEVLTASIQPVEVSAPERLISKIAKDKKILLPSGSKSSDRSSSAGDRSPAMYALVPPRGKLSSRCHMKSREKRLAPAPDDSSEALIRASKPLRKMTNKVRVVPPPNSYSWKSLEEFE